jgi:L-ascorbate metabolism protein UlaG (beta-lactamase superfamily)
LKIKFIGQSTFVFNINEKIVITDPWFSHKFLRKIPLQIDIEDIKNLDIMLVSHSHIDHLDFKSLKKAKELNSIFVGPISSCKRAKKIGIKEIFHLNPGEKIEVKGIKIYSLRAFHTFAKDALCYIIENEKKIFYSGDTKLEKELVENLRNYKIDIAIVQICCSYYPFKDGMDVEDAVKLVSEINPEIAIPMHYHIYFKSINPEVFKEKLKNKNIRVEIFKEGEEKEF